ncbi:MAG: RNA methyltransferase [Deltaproteobacteria bacterium]|nr:RNA methyltransferase [Deltaproteobacteria bacterium]MBK8235033.1 RNA methyltransferase [Deltaproteobacteria bacterium]MBP7285378.1 RNA methyltransferase [Nannocystaceae bacterium]
MPHLSIALLHHPVCNRLGEEITSTVDHFDVMDGSRLALTYGVYRLFVVNHLPAQQALVERLIRHGSAASERDDARGEFARTRWAPDLAAAIAELTREHGRAPTTLATSARIGGDAISFAHARVRLQAGEPMLLLMGKAWGLAPRVLEGADLRLQPIDAGTGFNHLSVRSAMAILVDRLLAPAAS